MSIKISVTGDKGQVSGILQKLFTRDKCEIAESLTMCDVLVAHGESSTKANHARAVVVNSDDKGAFSCTEGARMVITYGFNSRACVTASSVSKDSMQVCVQRSLPCVNGNVLEQQEFSLPLSNGDDPEAVLAATTAALVCGLTPNKISEEN